MNYDDIDRMVREADERQCQRCGCVFLTPLVSRTHSKRCPSCDRYVEGYRGRSDARGIRLHADV